MTITESSSRKRRRLTPLALIAGAVGSVLLALSLTGTLSGFVASITNTTNTAGTGALVMQEKDSTGSITCLSTNGGSVSTNAATCSTINKFGGNLAMVPGTVVSTNITITNTGTAPANTFTLTPGATCTQSANGAANGTATDLCAKLNVVITSGATTIYSGTAAALAGHAPFALAAPVAPGTTVPFTFAVTLASTADNTYQGLQASLPLTWAFAS